MVDAVNRQGGDARITIYAGVGHNAWERTYRSPDLFEWFLSHRRDKRDDAAVTCVTPPSINTIQKCWGERERGRDQPHPATRRRIA